MWYSFLGCILTVLFGYLISIAATKITERKLLGLTSCGTVPNSDQKVQIDTSLESMRKDAHAIFIAHKYDRPTAQQKHAFDNFALKVEDTV